LCATKRRGCGGRAGAGRDSGTYELRLRTSGVALGGKGLLATTGGEHLRGARGDRQKFVLVMDAAHIRHLVTVALLLCRSQGFL